MIFPNRPTASAQPASSPAATVEPVSVWWGLGGGGGDDVAQVGAVLVVQWFEVDHLHVHVVAVEVQDVRDATGHAGREVAAGRAENDGPATGHVLTAVVADTLDDRGGAGVADAEALADDAADEHLAGGGAVQDDVAGDDLLLGGERRVGGRPYGDPATGQSLADVVVGVADQAQRDPARDEGAERLPGRTGERDVDRVVGQPVGPPL